METVKQKEAKAFESLKDQFGYKNVMQAPRVESITVSNSFGKIKSDKNKVELIAEKLALITGQKPQEILAKKSIATFKVREGEKTAYKVTLNGDRMYEFLDKLINISIPRTKDFRGIKLTGVDQMGNLTIGVKENVIFPETGDEELRNIFGLSITIKSSSSNKEEATEFFKLIGIPFKKEEVK